MSLNRRQYFYEFVVLNCMTKFKNKEDVKYFMRFVDHERKIR